MPHIPHVSLGELGDVEIRSLIGVEGEVDKGATRTGGMHWSAPSAALAAGPFALRGTRRPGQSTEGSLGSAINPALQVEVNILWKLSGGDDGVVLGDGLRDGPLACLNP